MKRKRQESPRQGAFICVIRAGCSDGAQHGYWQLLEEHPDSEFRVLYVYGRVGPSCTKLTGGNPMRFA